MLTKQEIRNKIEQLRTKRFEIESEIKFYQNELVKIRQIPIINFEKTPSTSKTIRQKKYYLRLLIWLEMYPKGSLADLLNDKMTMIPTKYKEKIYNYYKEIHK